MKITEIWASNDEATWKLALKNANEETGRDDFIETKLSKLNVDYIKNLSTEEFYHFLYEYYYIWKYTAKNRLTTTRNSLKKYESDSNWNELMEIQGELFSFELNNTLLGLKIVTRIKGLGVAGGSGLLALLFPSYFGTVDEQATKALLITEEYEDDPIINKMNLQNIDIEDAIYLNQIYKKKAYELNKQFNSYSWTPRDIDVILWFYRNEDKL